MKRFLPKSAGAPQQRGLSVITGVFLLLLMSVMAAGNASLVNAMNRAQAVDIGGSRVYQAARAGAEWGMYQLDSNADNAAHPTCFAAGALTIFGYAVNVSCVRSAEYSEATRTYRVYSIQSTATGPGLERVIEVTLEKCRDTAISAKPHDCRD